MTDTDMMGELLKIQERLKELANEEAGLIYRRGALIGQMKKNEYRVKDIADQLGVTPQRVTRMRRKNPR